MINSTIQKVYTVAKYTYKMHTVNAESTHDAVDGAMIMRLPVMIAVLNCVLAVE